jgi:hypothetical protein
MRTALLLLWGTLAIQATAAPLGFMESTVPGLVGWWPLNEGTGRTVSDYSGGGNAGEYQSTASWEAGPIGPASVFGGGYLDLVGSGTGTNWLHLNTNKTVCAWFKTSNAGSGVRDLCTRQLEYMLSLNGNVLSTYDWVGSTLTTKGSALNDGAWHCVALSIAGGVSNGSFFFADGAQAGTSFTYQIQVGTTVRTSIAITHNGPGAEVYASQVYSGSIDDVRIYDRALTLEELQRLYNGGYGSQH